MERPVWDMQSSASTRLAMRAGIPLFAMFPIFFIPATLVVLTTNPWWLAFIPPSWIATRKLYGKNQNKPKEIFLWFWSGVALSSWKYWGGSSEDPHS